MQQQQQDQEQEQVHVQTHQQQQHLVSSTMKLFPSSSSSSSSSNAALSFGALHDTIDRHNDSITTTCNNCSKNDTNCDRLQYINDILRTKQVTPKSQHGLTIVLTGASRYVRICLYFAVPL